VLNAVVGERTVATQISKKALALGLFAAPFQVSESSLQLDLVKHWVTGSAVSAVRWWLEEKIPPLVERAAVKRVS
jgi:hypothetical protein